MIHGDWDLSLKQGFSILGLGEIDRLFRQEFELCVDIGISSVVIYSVHTCCCDLQHLSLLIEVLVF